MNRFLTSNEWQWRLLRTVVQGVLGVVAANVDLLMGVAVLDPTWRALCVAVLDPTWRALCMAMVMAVLSPVMAELGKADGSDE